MNLAKYAGDIDISNKQIVFGGDFNLIFHCKLKTSVGNPVLKKKSLPKLNEIIKSLNLCDIRGKMDRTLPPPSFTSHNQVIRFHSNKGRLFFCFKHARGFCQDNRFFVSSSTNHSLLFFSFEKEDDSVHAGGLWEFNKS